MNSVSSGNNWSNLFILAHEVGHHINGHSLDLVLYATETVEAATLASRRQQELEADEFAGFILGKLGASLPQTSQAINLLATNSDDTYSSHPSKSKRLEAISSGFFKGSGNIIENIEPRASKTAFEYWYSAYQKYKKEDFYGAITDYTNAIGINPKYGGAYNGRGSAKAELKDYYGAIADFSIAIEIDPSDDNSIWDRGYAKYQIKDYYGAISDFDRAIKFDPKSLYAFYYRGKAKSLINDHKGAIFDFSKGIEVEPNEYYSYFGRGFSKFELKDYYGAIADYNIVIELVPNLSEAYYNRGSAKYRVGDYSGACKDARKARELGNDLADELINNSCY